MVHGLSLATITGMVETLFVQVSTTWALICPETVHRRPCMTREIKTWLSDSKVGNNSVVDHRSRRPVISQLRNCVCLTILDAEMLAVEVEVLQYSTTKHFRDAVRKRTIIFKHGLRNARIDVAEHVVFDSS